MNKAMKSQAEADEEILTFDVPDAVLEQAGPNRRPSLCFIVLTSRPSAVRGTSVWRSDPGSLAMFAAIRRATLKN